MTFVTKMNDIDHSFFGAINKEGFEDLTEGFVK